jgi:hypothetical protein
MATTFRPASPKQINLIKRLAGEKVYDSGQLDRVLNGEEIGIGTASTLIDLLFKAPRKVQGEVAALTMGVYKLDGDVFIVKPNKEKTRLYAKRMVFTDTERAIEDGTRAKIEFVYAPGAIYRIKPEHKMNAVEGKALTIRYGRCICCNRALKAAQSVEQGIGPVCIKYFG